MELVQLGYKLNRTMTSETGTYEQLCQGAEVDGFDDQTHSKMHFVDEVRTKVVAHWKTRAVLSPGRDDKLYLAIQQHSDILLKYGYKKEEEIEDG